MSVIVMGMEMPTSCASCRMAVCFLDTGKAKCYATLSYIDPERGKRSYDCPLRPLPEKHGRLIDADAYIEMMQKDCDELATLDVVILKVCRGGINVMPTIVEAEGE